MTEIVLRAPPISWRKIADLTASLRKTLDLDAVKYFPIMDVLERILDQRLNIVRIEIEDDRVMGDTEAVTDPGGGFIRFSEKVYLQACDGKPRARWTAAHEAGHLFLHTNTPLARLSTKAEIEALKPFECPERQAHQFAAELLMPRALMTSGIKVKEIAADFGVSEEAAEKRLKYLESLIK